MPWFSLPFIFYLYLLFSSGIYTLPSLAPLGFCA